MDLAASSPAQSPQVLPSPEMAFFDVETTVPSRGKSHALLEFGAILVCPRRLVEVGCYSTLIRPSDPSSISAASVRCNGITRDTVGAAPSFAEVADRIFEVLHGRVWVGHNILRFDCARIREAFAEIGRPPPEPKGMIDTLPLLTQRFGRRAGNMKMATLATYFGLGQQKHRSLDDVRLNLEVLKYSAAVLFLESTLPNIFSRDLGDGSADTNRTNPSSNSPDSRPSDQPLAAFVIETPGAAESHVADTDTEPTARSHSDADLEAQVERMKIDQAPSSSNIAALRSSGNSAAEGIHACSTSEGRRRVYVGFSEPEENGGRGVYAGFLKPEEVETHRIGATLGHPTQFGRWLHLNYNNAPLHLCSMGAKILFGVNGKYLDHIGRPKLSIVVDAQSSGLCHVLNHCDNAARKALSESGSSSEWRPAIRNGCDGSSGNGGGYPNPPSIRLHIVSTGSTGGEPLYSAAMGTEILRKEASGSMWRLDLSRTAAAELGWWLAPGTIVDACVAVDAYDYQGFAGIRLVAKRLVISSS